MTAVYTVKIGTVFLLVAGLMFGCGGDDDATGPDTNGHTHGYDDDHEFEDAVNDLGLVFDSPADGGRPRTSFNVNISPILTNGCAIAGCHVAGGPRGIDLRTYDTLKVGGEHAAIIIAGDVRESEVIKQIVQGKMPPDGPPLEADQIQLIIDWINEGAENN